MNSRRLDTDLDTALKSHPEAYVWLDFAGQALAGMLACYSGPDSRFPIPEDAASRAFDYADAMLEQADARAWIYKPAMVETTAPAESPAAPSPAGSPTP